MDLVSIIIPYYRKKSFFKDAINSVKSQTYRNLEIIYHIIYNIEVIIECTSMKNIYRLSSFYKV